MWGRLVTCGRLAIGLLAASAAPKFVIPIVARSAGQGTLVPAPSGFWGSPASHIGVKISRFCQESFWRQAFVALCLPTAPTLGPCLANRGFRDWKPAPSAQPFRFRLGRSAPTLALSEWCVTRPEQSMALRSRRVNLCRPVAGHRRRSCGLELYELPVDPKALSLLIPSEDRTRYAPQVARSFAPAAH